MRISLPEWEMLDHLAHSAVVWNSDIITEWNIVIKLWNGMGTHYLNE